MKKILSFFVFVAIVISFAACGGNAPEVKDFTFKVNMITTRAHVTVTPLDNKKVYYWNYVEASELNGQTLQKFAEDFCSAFNVYGTSMGEEKEDVIFANPNTKYILWACYVEELESGQLKIIGDIVSKEITTKEKYFLEKEFSLGEHKTAVFCGCNYLSFESFDFPPYIFLGTTSTTASESNPQDLFTWTEMMEGKSTWAFLVSVPSADEWSYLFKERKNANERFTLATIRLDEAWRSQTEDIHGLIILPDDWQKPANVTLKTAKDLGLDWNEAHHAYEAASSFNGYAENVFSTTTQWWALEEAGAIFLPAAGGSGLSVNQSGYYWSSSESTSESTKAYRFMFTKNSLSLDGLVDPVMKTASISVRPIMYHTASISAK